MNGQLDALVAYLQPAIRMVVDGDALALEGRGNLVRLQQEHHPVVLEGEVLGDRSVLLPAEAAIHVLVVGHRSMDVLVGSGQL